MPLLVVVCWLHVVVWAQCWHCCACLSVFLARCCYLLRRFVFVVGWFVAVFALAYDLPRNWLGIVAAPLVFEAPTSWVGVVAVAAVVVAVLSGVVLGCAA